MAPRNRKTFLVVVFEDRLDERFCVFGPATSKSVGTFADLPAVIATFAKNADFFPFVLTNVPGPQFSGGAIKAHSPHVAQSPSPKFASKFGIFLVLLDGDGVVGRNAVPTSRVFVVDINSNDRAQQVCGVLGVVPRVARGTTISKRRIEHAIRSKEQG